MSTFEPLEGSYCPHCGYRNPPDANFCNRCGAAMAGDMEQPPADPAAPLAGSGFEADAAERGAITGNRAEQPVAQERGAPVEEVDERDLEYLLGSAGQKGSATEGSAGQKGSEPGDAPAADAPSTNVQSHSAKTALESVLFPDEQLLGGGQGYLESVAIAGDAPGPMAAADRLPPRPASADNDHWRTLRSLLRDEPTLATAAASGPTHPNYRPWWILLLIFAAALTPFFIGSGMIALGAPRVGPGVLRAYDAIAGLQVDDEVIVYWQADPATTGELNVVALPVISHLLDRGVRSIVISTLPAGVASARRLYSEATRGMDNSVMETVLQGWMGNGLFLSGGATALPLVARAPTQLLSFAATTAPAPQLALIIAPQADDVQQWLEIVQPVNGLPVVAVTAAAAEPLLQPYLESGQLAGLVSGFDGGASYQALRTEPLSAYAQRKQLLAVSVQNSGAVALLLILVAGNMARLFRRERRG